MQATVFDDAKDQQKKNWQYNRKLDKSRTTAVQYFSRLQVSSLARFDPHNEFAAGSVSRCESTMYFLKLRVSVKDVNENVSSLSNRQRLTGTPNINLAGLHVLLSKRDSSTMNRGQTPTYDENRISFSKPSSNRNNQITTDITRPSIRKTFSQKRRNEPRFPRVPRSPQSNLLGNSEHRGWRLPGRTSM